ncbi:uncharacterized protein [Rutidosis leptorrhynchoides]|uniref:uncharacterized protein isoform X2 n=1 Tax=Rutidosis leptorrhynchoides TaxID=125765 RepID=UPI003A9A0D43
MVEAQHMDKKMRESNGSLGVSVSFGKYESDALSWEKWSSFSPNKYLEEVGKCSTPGSVAQKKAFFEAHYKKVAAMKAEAELMDRLNATQTDDPSRSYEYAENSSVEIIKDVHEDCPEIKVCHSEEQVKAEISMVDESGNSQDEKLGNDYKDQCQFAAEATNTSVKDERFRDESSVVLESAEKPIEMNSSSRNSKADKLEEAVLVNSESMKLVKRHFKMDLETNESNKLEIPKPQSQDVTRKVNPNKMEKNQVGTKKKPASIVSASSQTSFAKLTKPKVTHTPVPKRANSSSASKNTISSSEFKKPIDSTSSLLKSKTPYLSQSMRVTPTSHHLSMIMTSVNSDAGSSVTSSRRRSLFMEQMGDKDIVKRVFKTFQNRVNQLPSTDSGPPKHLLTKISDKKATTSTALQKENDRSRKAVEKITPVRGQLGPTWKSVSSGSLKGVGVGDRRLNATQTSVNLISNEKAERRKKFCKNLEEKSNARVAERAQLSSKSKVAKDAEIKRLKQNQTFKAKPMPNFYRAQGLSKSTSEKEAIKNGTPRRPDLHR